MVIDSLLIYLAGVSRDHDNNNNNNNEHCKFNVLWFVLFAVR